jgi:hypothetical protein
MKNCRGFDVKVGSLVQLKAFEGPDPLVYGTVECFHPTKSGLVVLDLRITPDGGFYGSGRGEKVFLGEMIAHIDNLQAFPAEEEEE